MFTLSRDRSKGKYEICRGLRPSISLRKNLPDASLRMKLRRAVAAHMQSFDKKFGAGIERSKHAASHVS